MDEIRDVWEGNLEEELANIRKVIEHYPYVAMVRGVGLLGLLGLTCDV